MKKLPEDQKIIHKPKNCSFKMTKCPFQNKINFSHIIMKYYLVRNFKIMRLKFFSKIKVDELVKF